MLNIKMSPAMHVDGD